MDFSPEAPAESHQPGPAKKAVTLDRGRGDQLYLARLQVAILSLVRQGRSSVPTTGPVCQLPLAHISRQFGLASAPTIPQTASHFTRLR
jgi:hypothetical protein